MDELARVIEEVFYREDRSFAELRLYPSDTKLLAERYNVRCIPMDSVICEDGRRWYKAWMSEL